MRKLGKITRLATLAMALAAIAALFTHSPSVRAQDFNDDESRIQQGFAVAPVPLNLAGKNRALVGLGSYLVNAVADCNGCHSAGPKTQYVNPIGNPYLLPGLFTGKTQINPQTYLGGGYDFDQLPGSFPGPGPGYAHIVSRNLTPDKYGFPEGHTFSDFVTILRAGRDFDNAHPNCADPANPDGHCLPFPFNGVSLQIMPWPTFHNMTDHDLLAIYTYLTAIPCLEGDPGVPPPPGPPQPRCH